MNLIKFSISLGMKCTEEFKEYRKSNFEMYSIEQKKYIYSLHHWQRSSSRSSDSYNRKNIRKLFEIHKSLTKTKCSVHFLSQQVFQVYIIDFDIYINVLLFLNYVQDVDSCCCYCYAKFKNCSNQIKDTNLYLFSGRGLRCPMLSGST